MEGFVTPGVTAARPHVITEGDLPAAVFPSNLCLLPLRETQVPKLMLRYISVDVM